ncbi:chemotaxis protein CheW [filamentous cyanobacterium LEGE 11480]|uniref:Chemotaxis protein CheW n=1 Tax=Romeriopsis navalis LEGE 11480 TaxID=2777977 RepID=A0A928VIS5_9CYAN|nr:chemotaxis protein CheW [Romeriopsis navalis]MBE9029100.1 chemotaxis protein CheW [Romeriopsis navalis LEGE 11480]
MQVPVPQTAKPADRLQTLLPQLFEVDERTGNAFLRLQVSADTAMVLPLDCVEETQLLTPQDITPMPNMPNHVLGLMRIRGQVLWLSSLAKLLGLTTDVERAYRYETIVIRITPNAGGSESDSDSDLFLGLTVNQIKGSIRFAAEDIAPIEANVDSHLQPFLSGQVTQDNETLLILNPEALANIG